MIRYSKKNKDTDRGNHKETEYGAATYTLIDTPQAWNLAYLSHDFEAKVYHSDPYFSTHVRRTCQTKLDGSGFDLLQACRPQELFASLLTHPAPRFVFLILQHPILRTLPMFLSHGESWIRTIEERSWLCASVDPLYFDDKDPMDLSPARGALEKIRLHS